MPTNRLVLQIMLNKILNNRAKNQAPSGALLLGLSPRRTGHSVRRPTRERNRVRGSKEWRFHVALPRGGG
jgi:hypothetical protein